MPLSVSIVVIFFTFFIPLKEELASEALKSAKKKASSLAYPGLSKRKLTRPSHNSNG